MNRRGFLLLGVSAIGLTFFLTSKMEQNKKLNFTKINRQNIFTRMALKVQTPKEVCNQKVSWTAFEEFGVAPLGRVLIPTSEKNENICR